MAWTDAQGRPEILMNDSIICGTAPYRVVAATNPDTAREQAAPRPRRPLSPRRAAAAEAAAAAARGDEPAGS